MQKWKRKERRMQIAEWWTLGGAEWRRERGVEMQNRGEREGGGGRIEERKGGCRMEEGKRCGDGELRMKGGREGKIEERGSVEWRREKGKQNGG